MSTVILHAESSLGLGGQEIRIMTETRWLLAHGWDALVACQPESRLLVAARAAGLPFVAVKMRGPVDLRAIAALRRLAKEREVALVHTHSSIDSWAATLAAKTLGLPVVRSRHVSIPIPRRRALVYRLADRVITSGDAIRDVVRAAGVKAERIVSIPAGVDTTRFHPGVSGGAVRKELGLTGPVAGLVAMVRGSKGHRFFLEAAREILQALPETRFLIVGDGIGYEDVKRRVREMGLEQAVIMTGFRTDIPEVMAALDVLVLPSVRSEATSQVIPQALAVGTPVVATATGGIPEIIRDGETGRLVPPADPHALAHAILSLLRDRAYARQLAQAGQALVRERYTIEQMMAQTTRVYAELTGR
ncbi:MAG: glycosyltransferase family 4 protein [Candidatus Rokubacteria bacterium]|nr:glycosyltransferase family 4 protein [Candidatus Rokubacteria bacterium]